MLLENKKGLKKEFKIIMEIEKDKNNYIIYKDELNDNLYGGKVVKNKLMVLNDDEYNYLNNVVKGIKG